LRPLNKQQAKVRGIFHVTSILRIALASLFVVLAANAWGQAITRGSGNFTNIPPCPGRSSGATINTNRFADGAPLPSCGGREQSGNTIKTYELVWTGHVWAEYAPSVKVTTLAPANPTQPAKPERTVPLQLLQPGEQFRVQATNLGFAPNTAPVVGRTILYQGKQYRVVQLVGPSGGTIVSTNGGTIISSSSPYEVVLQLISNDGAT
jgi:hypothetical protein